ncbi:MAG: ABC transporter substrate-binding protein [Bacillota bacterium]
MKKIILISLIMILSLSSIIVFNMPSRGEDVITFVHRWPEDNFNSYFDYAIKQFQEQNPNVVFKMESFSPEEYEQKINMFFSTDNPPDIFYTSAGEYGNKYIGENQVLELTEYYDEDNIWSDNIIEAAVNSFTYDNKIYGVPISMDVRMLAYNKEIFNKLDIEVPETWSEFIKVLEILKEEGYIPLGYSDKTSLHGGLYITILNQRILGLDELRKGYNNGFSNEGYLEALKKIENLRPYINEHPEELSRIEERDMFMDGEIAIMSLHSQEFSYLEDMDYEWGVFNFPEIEEGKGDPSVIAGLPEGFMISKETENPVIAMEFLKFITSLEMSKEWVHMSNSISTTKGAVNKDNATPLEMEVIQEVRKANEFCFYLDNVMNIKVYQAYLEGIKQILNEEKRPEQVIYDIRKAAKKIRDTNKQ